MVGLNAVRGTAEFVDFPIVHIGVAARVLGQIDAQIFVARLVAFVVGPVPMAFANNSVFFDGLSEDEEVRTPSGTAPGAAPIPKAPPISDRRP